MIILSLDASTKSTGYALFEYDKELTLLDSGTWTASSPDLIKRIKKITNQLYKYIDTHNIDKIILEEVPMQMGNGGKTYRALTYLQAAFRFLFDEICPNTEVEFIYPSSWRSNCGIKVGAGHKREELKQADINFVNQTFNLNITNDDEADAIGIGYGTLHKKPQKKWGS